MDFTLLSLETERLLLRSLQESDASMLYPVIDEELTRYWIGWEPPQDMEELQADIQERLAQVTVGQEVCLLGFLKDTQEFIGYVGLTPRETRELEIDVWVKKSAQHHGFALEMVRKIIHWGKEQRLRPYFIYSITEGNTPSFKLLQKLGGGVFYQVTSADKRGVLKQVVDYKFEL